MSAELAFDSALMMMRAGRREEAARIAWEVIRIKPDHADAWALRAMVEAEAGRYQNAMLHHGFALRAAPHRYDLWVNRGIDAMNAKMFKEAEQSFAESLCQKETFEGHYNYGNFLLSTMRVEEAIREFNAALAFADHKQARTNLGTAQIGLGDWENGFRNYRSRFETPGFPPAPRLNFPQWEGQSLDGKTILLFAEQGFGDEIMGLRFAQAIKDMGARVIVAVRPPVFRLARSLKCADAVLHLYDPPPWQPDFMCALLDVPFFAGLTPAKMPGKGGYLSVEDRGHSLGFKPGLNVGICWASGKRDLQPHVAETARQKSLSFEQLVEPLARPGVNLVSLQQTHSDDAAMSRLYVHDPMPGVTDFADTAWIISHLDLVITVDTSVSHLAGALGKPVWNLVRFDALWPWMKEDSATSWYDSMRIYRQARPLDWSGPLEGLKSDFDLRCLRRKAAPKVDDRSYLNP